MKTDVDGRREGGGTDWPEWTMGVRGGRGGAADTVKLSPSCSFVPAVV